MSDNHEFYEERPLHTYHAQLPHCIDDAKLKPYEYRVYGHIKRICGELGGKCFKSIKHLAEHCDMSPRKMEMCLENLCKINPYLNEPLLRKHSRKKADGSNDTCIYQIVDMWAVNARLFSKKTSSHAYDAGGVAHDMREGGACGAKKEEPFKKNPFKKAASDKNSFENTDEKPANKTAAAAKNFISLRNPRGEIISLEESLVYRKLLAFPTEIIEEAIRKARETITPVGNIMKLIETICLRLQNTPKTTKVSQEIREKSQEERKRKLEEHMKLPKGRFIKQPNGTHKYERAK